MWSIVLLGVTADCLTTVNQNLSMVYLMFGFHQGSGLLSTSSKSKRVGRNFLPTLLSFLPVATIK